MVAAPFDFARLFEATRDLPSLRQWPRLLEAIVQRACQLIGAGASALYVIDPARQELEWVAGYGGQTPLHRVVPPGKGLAGQALQTRQPLVVSDYSAWPGRAPQFDPVPAQSAVAVLLASGNDCLGALVATAGPQASPLGPAEAEVLALFAGPAAAALANLREVQQARQRLAEREVQDRVAAALREVRAPDEVWQPLLDEALAGLEARDGSCWLYDPANDELVRVTAQGQHTQLPPRLKPHAGVPGRVFQTGQAYAAREFAADPYAHESIRAQLPAGWGGAAVPLRLNQELVGVLFLSVPLPRELAAAEVSLLAAVAGLAVTALERIRQGAEPQRRQQRLAAQRTIDTAISSSLDLNVTLSIILDQVTARLNVNAASILLLNPETHLLEYAAGRGFRTEAITRSRLRLDEDFAGRNALLRRFFSLPDLAQAGEPFARAGLLAAEGFVTHLGVPLTAKGRVKGVLEIFHRAAIQPDPEWLEFLEALAAQAAIAIDHAQMYHDLQRFNAELALAYDTTLEGWSKALELRDIETEGHTQRVTEMTLQLARAVGLEEAQLVHVRRGALLHDMGKMGVPDGILLKPGPLNEAELMIMRRHPEYAYQMLSPIAFLRPALDIPYCHHEKWDGTGYPRGLKGEEIPLAARVFAVADVWDALRSNRPYRPAWEADKVRRHIQDLAGAHFDPRLVDVFLQILP